MSEPAVHLSLMNNYYQRFSCDP